MNRPGGRSHHITAVILAGGAGARFHAEVAKQFLDLAGRPVVAHTIDTFGAIDGIASIVVVLPDEVPDFVHEWTDRDKVVATAVGGETRQQSLGAGLGCLPEECDMVVVHDAARPLVRPKIVSRVLEAFDGRWHGVICALGLGDALKEVSSAGEVLATKRRDHLWRAQTPQAFGREVLDDALARADADAFVGDDCSEIVTRAGYRVRVVEGDPWNLKVTYPADLALCEQIIAARLAAEKIRTSDLG